MKVFCHLCIFASGYSMQSYSPFGFKQFGIESELTIIATYVWILCIYLLGLMHVITRSCNVRYKMMEDCDLEQLPVATLASDNALVVTWVTNKQQQHTLVKDALYPAWKVTPVATWYWLKVLPMD